MLYNKINNFIQFVGFLGECQGSVNILWQEKQITVGKKLKMPL